LARRGRVGERERGTKGTGRRRRTRERGLRERRRRRRSGRRRPGLPLQNKNTAVAFHHHHPIYCTHITSQSIDRSPEERERESVEGSWRGERERRSALANPVLANSDKKKPHRARARKKGRRTHTTHTTQQQQHDDDDDDDDPGPLVERARKQLASRRFGCPRHTSAGFFSCCRRARPRGPVPREFCSLSCRSN